MHPNAAQFLFLGGNLPSAATWQEACFEQSKEESAYDQAPIGLSDPLADGDNAYHLLVMDTAG